MKGLSTEELQERLESGQAAVFDVRGDVEYEIGHIPGTKTAPLGSLVFRVARVMNPDSFVAVYSAGGDCHLGTQAAQRLESLGLRNVHRYEAGLEGWRAAGLPVEHIAHQGAIYLSVRFDLVGKTVGGQRILSNDDLRAALLRGAGFAVIPFEAFGLPETTTIITVGQGFVTVGSAVNAVPESAIETAVAIKAEQEVP